MTSKELADICFRKALVDVGTDKAFQSLVTLGQNPCAWLANPPRLRRRNHAGYAPLAVRRKNQEPEEEQQLNTESPSEHLDKQDSCLQDSGELKSVGTGLIRSTGIYAPLFYSSFSTPSATAEHNAEIQPAAD